jgi:hypothetical protein
MDAPASRIALVDHTELGLGGLAYLIRVSVPVLFTLCTSPSISRLQLWMFGPEID